MGSKAWKERTYMLLIRGVTSPIMSPYDNQINPTCDFLSSSFIVKLMATHVLFVKNILVVWFRDVVGYFKKSIIILKHKLYIIEVKNIYFFLM